MEWEAIKKKKTVCTETRLRGSWGNGLLTNSESVVWLRMTTSWPNLQQWRSCIVSFCTLLASYCAVRCTHNMYRDEMQKFYFCVTTDFTYCNDRQYPLEAPQQLFSLNLNISCSPKGSFAPSFPSGQLPLSFSLLRSSIVSLSPSFSVSFLRSWNWFQTRSTCWLDIPKLAAAPFQPHVFTKGRKGIWSHLNLKPFKNVRETKKETGIARKIKNDLNLEFLNQYFMTEGKKGHQANSCNRCHVPGIIFVNFQKSSFTKQHSKTRKDTKLSEVPANLSSTVEL